MKKILVSILALCMILSTTSCGDYKELEQSSPILSMGIDKEGEDYKISVELLNMNDYAGEITVKPQTLSATGKSIDEAIGSLRNVASEELYFSYLEVIILNEEIAKEGIDDIIDIILRNNDFRLSINLLVTKGDAKEILNSKSNLQPVHGVEISNALKESENNTSIVVITPINKIINTLFQNGMEVCLPSVKVEKGENKEGYSFDEIAVFKGSKLAGYVNNKLSKYYSFATDNAKKNTIIISNENFAAGGTVEKNKTDIELKGKTLYINLDTSICMNEFNAKNTLSLDTNKVKKEFKEKIEKNIYNLITTVQKNYGVDIFGYGLKINKFNPNEFKPYEKNWNEHFKNLNIKVNANISLNNDTDYKLAKGENSNE